MGCAGFLKGWGVLGGAGGVPRRAGVLGGKVFSVQIFCRTYRKKCLTYKKKHKKYLNLKTYYMTASTEIQRGVDIDGRGLLNSSVYRNGSELVEATPLTLKEIIYLETYAETFDHEKAMQVSGIRPDTLSRARKNNEFFNKNLLDIQQAWMEKVKLRPELMGSKLVKLTAKLEQAFDEGKHSVASPLIKAVELGMRAAGMLSSDSKDTGTQIHFTLNLGFDQPKKEKTAKIKEINIIPDNL